MKRIISPEEYSDLRSSGEKHVSIDVRSAEEFSGSHIKGAVNLPVEKVEGGIALIAGGKDTLLVLNCKAGGRAGRTLAVLEKMGYTNAHALKGSYLDVK